MHGTKRQKFETAFYSYGQVERALASVFNADLATQQGAVRGRLKRLATLGLPATSPGKGSRRSYSWEEAVQLLIALLMENAGLDPTIIVPVIEKYWPKFARQIKHSASETEETMVLCMRLEAMRGPWQTKDPSSAVSWISLLSYNVETNELMGNHSYHRDKDAVVVKHLPLGGISMHPKEPIPPGWVASCPLTAALNNFQAALNQSPEIK